MCGPMNSNKRILAVYGTEMGSTKVEAKKIVGSWEEKENLAVELLEGNEAADVFDTITPKKYDLLVVFTSSYGDGDAPSGYGKFLYKIYEAAKEGNKPLSGLEHSVLGFGSTAYETFQNIPRLTDRLLGHSGSRRFLKRTEIDEMDDFEEIEGNIRAWRESVAKHCAEAKDTVSTPSVCEWTEPKSDVYEKTLGADGYEVGARPSQMGGLAFVPIIGAVAAFAYYRFYQEPEST
ncbi:hypothetical protein THAOC_34994 [Thalassiosira oceanica]|uniref:Flavodoxin-like domain-containing protein n=1 Tax=Thalassiosira oceanica TaxID=159749 RepID=K0RB84_THAOC|nr:hypothetical protein THAOC_34994 [Thalassiosira oceanica]|eukprot:EJK46341.1 hypothetical protein THAOC_34994 [Thalassiosira oceanica]